MDSILALASQPAAWAALGTLIVMEVVLGIDNLLFISILTNKLPEHQRARVRFIGIGAALVLRLALLSLVFVIVQLTAPVISVFGQDFSWRDLILIGGGLFLVWKATKEIHHNVDPDHGPDVFDGGGAAVSVGYAAVVGQILILDLVFSLDSIITAVGMTDHIEIMVVAVVVTVAVMLFAANPLGNFIGNNPTVVMLALAFLLMIGTTLIAEGFGVKVPKGYVYGAMAFSAAVEALNMLSRRAAARRSGDSARMPVRR
ncbi:TerC family protein [Plastoroseomonas hellenica]|uniref:TerC family protein n=1 Tax=Plastoroseomonas hellenica TaxID=2687306 RepID=A0ABS5F9S6_9PROT|nr:TerC family protein [Plastoroseomonas hellenica]MBR0647702.1 TerC family protein [Plastoroseomonas hellenica]MBR0669321.1 TerC family protein [Plastoroseomonas hellenica]